MTRRYPSGHLPADFMPAKQERPPVAVDHDRNFTLFHNDPATHAKARAYVQGEKDAEFLLAVLGLT